MSDRAQELAAAFCELVGVEDLVSWLGLTSAVAPSAAKAALKKKRSWYQSMQANPKHKEAARFLIKNYRSIEAALDDPELYLDAVNARQAESRLPMLEMVIDGVLADGALTPQEEAFVRESAMQLGISDEVFRSVLEKRARAAGVALPSLTSLPPPVSGLGEITIDIPRMAPGTGGSGWWNEAFSTFLLDAIPEDTHRLVDFAAGLGWGALTILPHRGRVEYLGLDQDKNRLEMATKTLRSSPVAGRVQFVPAAPEKLPLPGDAVDLVLCVMALHRMTDVHQVISEAMRVLRPGGRVVMVEPDRGATHFWFDGELEEVNATYREFLVAADQRLARDQPAGRAPGLSTGPLLSGYMAGLGLVPTQVKVHHVVDQRLELGSTFADRMATEVAGRARSARMRSKNAALQACNEAIDEFERHRREQIGAGVISTPLFLSVGLKPT